ncbi:MAG: sigma-54-dependent Fis family transcriptional regulator [Acidobacteria bacterium]|nr:sigma-54-dependent Fis family transcriptional regulator [Acidobacteriota bacterium]
MSPDNDRRYPFVFSAGSPMLSVYRTLEKVRESPTTVLIEGESGTGKDALAQWLHYNSPRKDGPLMKVDFASLPEELVESELFGYERGAFTGAVNSKLGKLDLAQGGTAVLDEIASVDMAVQAKLLNVVEAKVFYRLGGTKPVELDARIVALSSVPLAAAVERQVFRQDLFFRLNLITIRVPPLRERANEIFPMAQFLLAQLGRKYKTVSSLNPETRPVLERYDFPGNIRELRNALERAMLMTPGQEIQPEMLPAAWSASRQPAAKMPSLEDIERDYISEVLRQTRGKKVKAAKILGISRKTLLEKRKKYGLL